MHEPTICFSGDDWISTAQLAISISDVGFRQGVTAVERLRTYERSLFQKQAHLDRWLATTSALEITGLPSPERTADLLGELLRRNRAAVDRWGETGITMFASPGDDHTQPTFALHLNPIDLDQVRQRQQQGQPVVVTDVVQPPPESWPRSLKVRCRLHYYRADMLARRHCPAALGVLLDSDGTITETSIANLAIVSGDQIISPPEDRVLGGVTQTVVRRIAADLQISWEQRPITVQQLIQADEVLLMGTDGGVWFANSVNGKQLTPPGDPSVYLRLLRAFQLQCRRGR